MGELKTVKTFMTALQSGDMDLASSVMADSFTMTGMTPKTLNKGQFLAMQSELLAAMPDFSYNLNGEHREEDVIVGTITPTGSHTDDLALPLFGVQSIPASGIAVTLPQTGVTYSFENDLIAKMEVENISGGGLAGLLQQVGAELPVPPRLGNIGDML